MQVTKTASVTPVQPTVPQASATFYPRRCQSVNCAGFIGASVAQKLDDQWMQRAEQLLGQVKPKLDAIRQLIADATGAKIPGSLAELQELKKKAEAGTAWVDMYQSRLELLGGAIEVKSAEELLQRIPSMKISEAMQLRDLAHKAQQCARVIDRLIGTRPPNVGARAMGAEAGAEARAEAAAGAGAEAGVETGAEAGAEASSSSSSTTLSALDASSATAPPSLPVATTPTPSDAPSRSLSCSASSSSLSATAATAAPPPPPTAHLENAAPSPRPGRGKSTATTLSPAATVAITEAIRPSQAQVMRVILQAHKCRPVVVPRLDELKLKYVRATDDWAKDAIRTLRLKIGPLSEKESPHLEALIAALEPVVHMGFTFDEMREKEGERGGGAASGEPMVISPEAEEAPGACTDHEVRCLCRLPENAKKSTLVQCDECAEWYHLSCIHLSAKELKARRKQPLFCPICLHRRGFPSELACPPPLTARRVGAFARVSFGAVKRVLEAGKRLPLVSVNAVTLLSYLVDTAEAFKQRAAAAVEAATAMPQVETPEAVGTVVAATAEVTKEAAAAAAAAVETEVSAVEIEVVPALVEGRTSPTNAAAGMPVAEVGVAGPAIVVESDTPPGGTPTAIDMAGVSGTATLLLAMPPSAAAMERPAGDVLLTKVLAKRELGVQTIQGLCKLVSEGAGLEVDMQQDIASLRRAIWEQVVPMCFTESTDVDQALGIRQHLGPVDHPFSLMMFQQILESGRKLGLQSSDLYIRCADAEAKITTWLRTAESSKFGSDELVQLADQALPCPRMVLMGELGFRRVLAAQLHAERQHRKALDAELGTQAPALSTEPEVYCICRRRDDGTCMVACESCDEWFHIGCINEALAGKKKFEGDFTCPICVALAPPVAPPVLPPVLPAAQEAAMGVVPARESPRPLSLGDELPQYREDWDQEMLQGQSAGQERWSGHGQWPGQGELHGVVETCPQPQQPYLHEPHGYPHLPPAEEGQHLCRVQQVQPPNHQAQGPQPPWVQPTQMPPREADGLPRWEEPPRQATYEYQRPATDPFHTQQLHASQQVRAPRAHPAAVHEPASAASTEANNQQHPEW